MIQKGRTWQTIQDQLLGFHIATCVKDEFQPLELRCSGLENFVPNLCHGIITILMWMESALQE